MTDIASTLAGLRRPRLLIRAARFGQHDYVRDRDLKRLTGLDRAPTPSVAVNMLMEREAAADEARRSGTEPYSVAKHVALLVALMAEARLLPSSA